MSYFLFGCALFLALLIFGQTRTTRKLLKERARLAEKLHRRNAEIVAILQSVPHQVFKDRIPRWEALLVKAVVLYSTLTDNNQSAESRTMAIQEIEPLKAEAKTLGDSSAHIEELNAFHELQSPTSSERMKHRFDYHNIDGFLDDVCALTHRIENVLRNLKESDSFREGDKVTNVHDLDPLWKAYLPGYKYDQ